MSGQIVGEVRLSERLWTSLLFQSICRGSADKVFELWLPSFKFPHSANMPAARVLHPINISPGTAM